MTLQDITNTQGSQVYNALENSNYPTLLQQFALVDKKLATYKQVGDLVTFKYARKVMFDNLWKKHNVFETRGHTYNLNTGKIVILAPRKSFNYGENGHWLDVDMQTECIAFKKYNGFLCNASLREKNLVVGTTGTTNSTYAEHAKELMWDYYSQFEEGKTYHFEILWNEDPHIVDEGFTGPVFLGSRCHTTGFSTPASNTEAPLYGTLEEIIKMASTDRGEGFMVYKASSTDGLDVCKLKTPYYAGKKKLMRMPAQSVEKMYQGSFAVASLPSMWHNAVQLITEKVFKDKWLNFTDQDRRKWLEDNYEIKD